MAGEREGEGKDTTQKEDGWKKENHMKWKNQMSNWRRGEKKVWRDKDKGERRPM